MDFRGASSSDFDFAALPPEDAIAYFRRKGMARPEQRFDWRDMWQDEHARTFVVAKAMTLDLLQDLRSAVDQAIAEGIAFDDFRANLEPILRAQGWWGRQLMVDPLTGKARDVQLGSVRRLEIIYDTNLRTSFSAGAWKQVQESKALQPYLRYVDPDPNPLPEHLDWSGTVLRVDDDWWKTHWPPNGFHCKCYADSLSEEDLHRENIPLSVAPREDYREYYNPRTQTTEMIPRGIDPGFAHNPGIAGINYAAEQNLKGKLATADADLAKAVEQIEPPTGRHVNPSLDEAIAAGKRIAVETGMPVEAPTPASVREWRAQLLARLKAERGRPVSRLVGAQI